MAVDAVLREPLFSLLIAETGKNTGKIGKSAPLQTRLTALNAAIAAILASLDAPFRG